MAYVKPIRPIIVVKKEYVDKLDAMRPDKAAREREKELVALFRENQHTSEKKN